MHSPLRFQGDSPTVGNVTEAVPVPSRRPLVTVLRVVQMYICVLLWPAGACAADTGKSIWSHDNIIAWCVAPPWDALSRSPEDRALMIKRLGLQHYAYNWRKPTPRFEDEIEAMQRHGIDFVGWFLYSSENPALPEVMAAIASHGIQPDIWLNQNKANTPQSPEDWDRLLPPNVRWPRNAEESARLSEADRNLIKMAQERAKELDFPRTAEEQKQRVAFEAGRISQLVSKFTPLGCRVQLYNHNGWFGMVENQVAIIEQLATMGITDVGMVYNFSHARDERHDDTRHFREVWTKIKPYVVTVNITGMCMEGKLIYPSQGDAELDMMRIIQESGWTGRIGLIAEKGGDAEVTMQNYLKGLDWLVAELRHSGSGGPPPFPTVMPCR